MSKKEKKTKSIKESEELVENKSVTSILSEDKNKIADATTEAKKTIDSVAYADNLVPPSKKSKSIRSLNIEEKKEAKKIEKETKKELQEKKAESDNEYEIDKTTSFDNAEQIKKEENIDTTISSSAKKSHKTLIIVSFSILAIFLLFFIFSTVFALITSYQTTIINGIKIKDIDVSGLSKEDAILKVSSAFKEKLEKQITLQYNDYSITIFPEQFDVSFEIEEAVNMAYGKGRTRKYFSK